MTGRKLKFEAEVVNGKCPTCAEEYTMLVGITPEMYRCINCGADLEQHINGKISYIPTLPNGQIVKEYFNGKES